MNLRSRVPFRPTFSADEFRNIKMPMLLLIGDREVLYDARLAIERAQQLIPQIEAELIPIAGHMLGTDQPDVVMGRVLRFLPAY